MTNNKQSWFIYLFTLCSSWAFHIFCLLLLFFLPMAAVPIGNIFSRHTRQDPIFRFRSQSTMLLLVEYDGTCSSCWLCLSADWISAKLSSETILSFFFAESWNIRLLWINNSALKEESGLQARQVIWLRFNKDINTCSTVIQLFLLLAKNRVNIFSGYGFLTSKN